MHVIQTLSEAEALVKAIDYLSRETNSGRGKSSLLDLLREGTLPACLVIERDGNGPTAPIKTVKFKNLPSTLELQSPEFRQCLQALHKWCDAAHRPVEQMMLDLKRANSGLGQAYSWMDIPFPNGHVRTVDEKGKKTTEVTNSAANAKGNEWHRFNLDRNALPI